MLSSQSAFGLSRLFLALPVFAALGCSALSLQPPGAGAAASTPESKAVIEVRPDGKKPRVMEMAVSAETRVQDAVAASRKLKKFRRMDVAIYRSTPEGRRVRLQCRYDIGDKQIAPENDYALQPGDYVVISEDTSTVIDDMFRNVSGPLRSMLR